jgi:hypothetical protein
MERTRHYRDLAAQCVLIATESEDSNHRATLLGMAQRWLDLAAQAEQTEIRDPDEKSN